MTIRLQDGSHKPKFLEEVRRAMRLGQREKALKGSALNKRPR